MDKTDTVQVYTGCYSSPYYELEAWKTTDWISEADAQKSVSEKGTMPAPYLIDSLGIYPQKERAIADMNMALDDNEYHLRYFFVRVRPYCILMPRHAYLKEWTFEYGLLEDESLTRNYDEGNNPFLGRPKHTIRFAIGDIVLALDQEEAFYGVVASLPPIEDGTKHGDWRDDSYEIITSLGHSRRVPCHHVVNSWNSQMPEYVKNYLNLCRDTIFKNI